MVHERDDGGTDALLVDRYLDALLAGTAGPGDGHRDGSGNDGRLDPAVRAAADRLRHDLVRVHPSFRFEERLANRLAEAGLALRVPLAVGAGRRLVAFPSRADAIVGEPFAIDPGDPFPALPEFAAGPAAPLGADQDLARRDRARPLLIGGALTSAAISIAGAAFVAWRHGRPSRGSTPDGTRGADRPRCCAGRRSRSSPRQARRMPSAGGSTDMPIKLPSFRPRRDAYPPDLWTKCPSCGEMLFNKQLDKVLRVCPSCGHHFRLAAAARIEMLVDPGTFAERDAGLESEDPLHFTDQKSYPDRIATAQLATGMRDAAIWGTAAVDQRPIALCVMDFGFMGGSMGAVVGEKVARATEHALEARIPLVIVSASGGARMQEGTLSLMQLAKTVAALERLRASGVPFLSLLSDPTTGGVFASFAVLGDVNIAEPNALIGFAGARVVGRHDRPGAAAGFPALGIPVRARLPRPGRSTAPTSGPSSATLLRFLVARPGAQRADDAPDGDPLGLPSFRPLSFLSNLAERVLPPRPDDPLPARARTAGSPADSDVAGSRRPVRTTTAPKTTAPTDRPEAARAAGAGAAPLAQAGRTRPSRRPE